MQKKILIASAIIIFILFIIFCILYFKNNATQVPATLSTTTQEKITLPTTNGSVITNDYYSNPNNIVLDEKDVVLEKNEDYEILAFDYNNEKSFLISIKSNDPETARKNAERSFFDLLGINQKQACLLSVSLAVSKDVDMRLAGQDFGLSFCPNGKPFYPTK